MYSIFANSYSVAEMTLKTWHSNGKGAFPQLRSAVAAVLILQTRGGKKKFGDITRDPFKTFQKKLGRKQQIRHAKYRLQSDERREMKLAFPFNIQSSGHLISGYVPLEKFARAPLYTGQGLRQRWRAFKEGITIIYSGAIIRRKLRKTDPFRPIEFARQAQKQFVEANAAMQRKDKQTLRTLATEQATETLKQEFEHKRFVWQLVEELERPRVVNARVAPFDSKDSLLAQVVVRMHTKQILALYNSVGTLTKGHPTRPKDVIDYVVFERLLAKPHSRWRITTKLPPQLPWRTGDSDRAREQKSITA